MTKESRRKWILGTIGVVIFGGPFALLNSWTLDAIQDDIRKTIEAGKPDTGLADRQLQVASAYRYTFRSDSAEQALRQYMKLFYANDRGSETSAAKKRAQDAIYDYASLLDEDDHRSQAYYYYWILSHDWEEHPQKEKVATRMHDFEKAGNTNWAPPPGEEQ